MFKRFQFIIIAFSLFLCGTLTAQNPPLENNSKLVEQLLRSRPDLFGGILKHVEKYEVQILYTQIDRDQNNNPSFRSFSYRLNAKEYFIKKIFLVSDNDAYNRLYEFIGQRKLNEALWKKGFKNLKLVHRLAIALSAEQNRHTNPFTFYDGDKIIYQQPPGFNPLVFPNKLKTTRRGQGFIRNDSLINEPKDFSRNNYISLANLQGLLKAVMFPEAVKLQQRFLLTEDDYRFLYKYMSMLPAECAYPEYDTMEYYDSHDKFFVFGDSKQRIPPNIRIFNKIGQAFGYLIDNAYIYEKARPRKYAPNLEKFKINYFETRKEARVNVNVIAPASTPASARLFVAGNQPGLGNWDPGKVELKRQNDSLWRFV